MGGRVERSLIIALAGNPNCGKSSIFNNLTGIQQHVGNWPGVTVEKKEGTCVYGAYTIQVVDLPGTYSLATHSLDEVIARNFIVEEKPDVVVPHRRPPRDRNPLHTQEEPPPGPQADVDDQEKAEGQHEDRRAGPLQDRADSRLDRLPAGIALVHVAAIENVGVAIA